MALQRTRVALLGAGDLGRTLVAQMHDHPSYEPVGYFDDTRRGEQVHGLPVFGGLDEVADERGRGRFDEVLIAIGYKHLGFRTALFERLHAAGVPFATLVHPTAFVHASATIAAGAVLFPRCVIDAESRVGANSLLNTACVVAHDTTIGAHTFLGPAVTLAGFVRVGERCFLGVGTVVIDNLSLADGAQTGGGAVVTRDVAGETLVVGVPARPLRSVVR